LFGIAGGFADRGPSRFDISISQSDDGGICVQYL
jgi:hypothetical protein